MRCLHINYNNDGRLERRRGRGEKVRGSGRGNFKRKSERELAKIIKHSTCNTTYVIPKYASLHGTQNVAFAPILYEKNSF